ncbi:transcription factor Tfb4 [Aspergillus steynii IBT 23096]|uniref:General transcription and DNA repair factor IIH subunit TFB4 n=1 Tax=Aspergillus steynii IBT 23096 TaxID=1392250 RepID=A0A2I2G303_9EURO|nr:transcription factor Tfb4 [Aspergillus steynii IBT 23096]PLB47256.1 transcription factor Tfb4 [Aspergillus steynii IBT 23096]
MNSVDATEHYETSAHDPAPSLLTVIFDTNPHAWALLENELPLSKAIANVLVFLNAHLACNYANEVAVVASHSQQATWLYPREENQNPSAVDKNGTTGVPQSQVNKYRPFRIVEEQVTRNLHALMAETSVSDVKSTSATMMAGALTLALSHINRRSIAWSEAHGGDTSTADGGSGAPGTGPGTGPGGTSASEGGLQSRILIVSVSGSSDSAHQYIPIMNGIFACQRLHIPIDVCKLRGDAVFLQQASDATRGAYMALTEPRGLLQYLMMAFLPDQRSRRHLVLPTRVDVDFRAACFCHRRVVDIGFVCSICLSIFCEPPENGNCLTCGTHLEMGDYGAKPALIARKKAKKKKPRANGPSGTATPTPTPTPGP